MAVRFIGLAFAVIEISLPYIILTAIAICIGCKAIADEVEYSRWKTISKERS